MLYVLTSGYLSIATAAIAWVCVLPSASMEVVDISGSTNTGRGGGTSFRAPLPTVISDSTDEVECPEIVCSFRCNSDTRASACSRACKLNSSTTRHTHNALIYQKVAQNSDAVLTTRGPVERDGLVPVTETRGLSNLDVILIALYAAPRFGL